SNVFVLLGTNYGERLMYAPSVGFCLAVACLIAWRSSQPNSVEAPGRTLTQFWAAHSRSVMVTVLIVSFYSVKTLTRNRDWHDNLTLYEQSVKSAPNSARSHYYLGNQLTQSSFLATVDDRTD